MSKVSGSDGVLLWENLMLSFCKTLKIILGLKKYPSWNPGMEWIAAVKRMNSLLSLF